ncbi:putative 2OG-Fe(II) oxygenase [Phenylobacterium sp. J367]|uniref:putative 2OG-Fe(II) oxygenase n=1 Tax=Phenylobacterium sp. J367 TaxID=2898435 RepID=UPI002150F65C|nr:putative 2OG-Fe(II) oxygenase [Phenylobacterium sp. J367]MCR5880736.1 tetratricopeptide repeat protein [Phenylobacterium sp. J367]
MAGNPVLERARALIDTGRLDEAYALTAPLAQAAEPEHRALALHATILKGLKRREDALVYDRKAVERFPTSGVAWHNLGATLGDLGRGRESAAAVEKAFALGIDSPLTWGVMARARLATGELDAAEAAYREALRRAPGNEATAAEFANILWMRHGDMDAAMAVLDRAFHGGGNPAPLVLAKAKLLDAAGRNDQAADLLSRAAERLAHDHQILLAACQAVLEAGRLAEAERLVLAADTAQPNNPGVMNQMAIVYLALGRPDVALARVRHGLSIQPENQSLWGWAATAARAVGDPLHAELYDYDAMVGTYEIDAPDGWASREAFLADLATSLEGLHQYAEHPTNQSLRHGSQTMHLLTGSDDPAIRAFFQALEVPIRAHMAKLGQGTDPLRRRHTGDYRIQGAWSVRLRSGGFHKDHFHPEGWLSSAFYVETPAEALGRGGKEGWLRLGQPPFRTDPPLSPERWIRPEPGRLVLFPSYMWHGTEPFTTDEHRMTIAFDVVPA